MPEVCPVVTERVSDDSGSGPELLVRHRTRVPPRTQWLREVTSVEPSRSGINAFEGEYVRTNKQGRGPNEHEYARIRPGSLLLTCVKNRQGHEHIVVFMYLPEDIWWQTGFEPVVRSTGWHLLVRSHIQSWVALSRVQRIVRACMEATAEARNLLYERTDEEHDDEYEALLAAITHDEYEALLAAITHMQDIVNTVTGNIRELTHDSIRRSFDAWAHSIEETTQASRDEVLGLLSEALVDDTTDVPEIPHLNDLLDRLLNAVAPDGSLRPSRMGRDDLEQVSTLVTNIASSVHVEREVRTWQLNVLHTLDAQLQAKHNAGMQIITISDLTVDRDFTAALQRGARHAAEYLNDTRRIPATAEDISVALSNAVQQGTEQPSATAPSAENRLARNIRIGRRKTSG